MPEDDDKRSFSNDIDKTTKDVENTKNQETEKEKIKEDSKKEESSKESSKQDDGKKESVEIITRRKKTLSAIGYISFFCILPLAMEQDSEFCKLHGKQGMIITITFFILEWFGRFSSFLWFLLFLIHVGLIAWGMYLSFKDEKVKIPIIGDMAEKIEI